MNFQQLIHLIMSRYKTVLTVFFSTVVFVVLVSFVLPPIYKSTSSIVVDVKSPDPVGGMYSPALAMPGYMSTQSDIVASDRVALKAIKMLKLDENANVKERWLSATDGKDNLDQWLVGWLQKKLDVKSSPDSNVLNIIFSADDPNLAAAISNAFAQAFIETNIELQIQPAKQYSLWFDERLKAVRANMEQAQARLSDYQQKSGIVMADQNLDFTNAQLGQLTGQLAIAQGQTADTQSREKHEGAKDTMQDVLLNPMIQSIKAQIIQLQAKQQDLNVGQNHPQFKALQVEIDTLKQKLDYETNLIVTSITTTNQVNKQRETELKGSIEKQNAKALEINKRRDEMRILQNEVMAAEKAYEVMAQRVSDVNVQSYANQTNVSLLSEAAPPLKPWFPNLPLNVIIAMFLGTVFGVAAAFIRESSDRRVRTLEDLDIGMGLPVLAQFRSPPPKRRFLMFARNS